MRTLIMHMKLWHWPTDCARHHLVYMTLSRMRVRAGRFLQLSLVPLPNASRAMMSSGLGVSAYLQWKVDGRHTDMHVSIARHLIDVRL